MDKLYLENSAQQLKSVSSGTYEEYNNAGDRLIAIINETMLARPDIISLVGESNLEMMKDNHANHVRFIASILKNHHTHVLVETVLWVFRAYRSHGFSTNYWAAQLNAWMGILKKELSEESYREVYPYYEWMQVNIPVFTQLTGQPPGSTDL